MTGSTLALDMGATKIGYGIVDDDEPLACHTYGRIPTRVEGSTPAEQVKAALRVALGRARVPITRVGIGAPGIVDPAAARVIHAGPTLPGWAGTDLAELVASVCTAPFACHNDVRIWAYGEHHIGAGRALRGRVLYVSLGTGVGGAVVDDGALLRGPRGTAGEISEIVCPDFRGLAARCEDVASGNSLARYYNDLHDSPDSMAPVPWREWAEDDLRLPAVIERARLGDELAGRIIDGNLRGFGRALGAFVSALDINGIVVGGGVAEAGDIIMDPLRAGVRGGALAPSRDVAIVRSELTEYAPIVAAAAYARDHAS